MIDRTKNTFLGSRRDSCLGSCFHCSLQSPLTLRNALRFPVQSAASRREVLIGALWLFVPVYGWLLNMGHRIVITHQLIGGRPGWPAWVSHRAMLRHGLVTFAGMVLYHLPASACFALASWTGAPAWWWVGGALWVLATCAVPGYMTAYCVELDPREVFDPFRALRRVLEGGAAYWHAWAIVLACLALSFVGLLAFGVGFLVTSVWFWQSAAFCFASVMVRSQGYGARTLGV